MENPKKGKSFVRSVILGLILGAILAVGFAMVFAKLCEDGIISEKRIVLTALVSVFLAVLISTFVAGRCAEKMKFPAALCVGGGELLLSVILHALFLQGEFYHILWLCVLFAIATGVGGVLSVQKRKKHKFA